MGEVLERIAACLLCTAFFACISVKALGAMQQAGYKNTTFFQWLTRKGNMLNNRLCVLALCLALSTAVFALSFAFLEAKLALLLSAIPFFALLILYLVSDAKYSLKVRTKFTPRLKRLFVLHIFLVACLSYALIAFLGFLSAWNGSALYQLIAYVPVAVMPMTLPFVLIFANAIISPFEERRNAKFIKRAGQVLDETQIIRIGIVGSYGKTSVKNILATILKEKYSVVATPQSYNTPMGIARTVFSEDFAKKQVLIAEMGARQAGDISALAGLVKPDFAIFTGVCEQHIATFGSVENAFLEKSEIIKSGAFCVCGESLKGRIDEAFEESYVQEAVEFGGLSCVKNLQFLPTQTKFTLLLGEEEICVTTALLGGAAVENIALAAVLAYEGLGLTVEEIARGIEKLEQIPHRLQLMQSGGAYILDDGYNANVVGAKEALAALSRFEKGKCVVTPGLVECGVLEEKLNGELGEEIAKAGLDQVILVGETLIGAVKKGYLKAGGDEKRLVCVKTLDGAKEVLASWLSEGDCVLFLNDLPDVYVA